MKSVRGGFVRRILYLIGLMGLLSFKLQGQEIRLISPELIDLGKLQEGATADGDIFFLNSGNQPLGIQQIKTSCGCTIAQNEKEVYAPGDTIKIHFSVNTRGFRNVVRKTITVFFQDEKIEDLRYTIQMDIFTDLELSPRFISFRHVQINPDTVITNYFTIQNNSEKPVKIKKVTSNYDLVEVYPQSITIPAKKEHLFRIELRPKRVEQRSVSINIETDNKQKNNLLQPAYVQIEE
jgi:hypothetical protein